MPDLDQAVDFFVNVIGGFVGFFLALVLMNFTNRANASASRPNAKSANPAKLAQAARHASRWGLAAIVHPDGVTLIRASTYPGQYLTCYLPNPKKGT
mgnify:CR=1 FL=1